MSPDPAMNALEEIPANLLAKAQRRARLLRAAALVSRNISSILDPDDLLARTVNIICTEYGFYYAGIFLIERLPDGHDWAVLKAGRGEAGRLMLENHHKLMVGGHSMVGACTALNQARIALDVGKEAVWFNNPFLPDTRSEMALPLAIGPEVMGALTVQSMEEAAFSEEDISSLQAMADQLAVAINNARLHKQNEQLFYQASRRAVLLQAGAEVSRNITSILDLDVLLSSTVYIICEEYGFYYAGIYLIDDTPDDNGLTWAVLRAGRGEAGRKLVEQGYRLPVGGESVVSAAIIHKQAQIALDVDNLKAWQPHPLLADTRSVMALPLIFKDDVIGALSVQSKEEAAFSREDISALQMMADQLAAAINNARLLRDLAETNEELLRTKTFETIATATGQTIHWVGNKAAPIPACVDRVRTDVSHFVYLAGELLQQVESLAQCSPAAQAIIAARRYLDTRSPGLAAGAARLMEQPPSTLEQMLSIESVLEDLDIIEQSSNTILQIKEDLIGPARHMNIVKADVVQVIKENIKFFGLPPAMISCRTVGIIPPVAIDPHQMGQVITNLIKNALEAMDGQPKPHITVTFCPAKSNLVQIDIADNGCGIPETELTKIWLTFHTNKAAKGGTGLGLPACLQIMERMHGQISVSSRVGQGATFTLLVPVYQHKP
jgi:signal transduction histidine kinase